MQCDPGANKRTLLRRVKAYIMEKETTKRLECAKSRKHQGQLLCETEDEAAGIWSSAVLQLPPQVLRFSINTAQDTLPHNANLSLWKKYDSLSDVCRLCGRRQTLAHVLNQCPTSLHLRRYNIRHDAVLEVIPQGIQPYLLPSYSMLADLPSTFSYTFPPHISLTSLRPDLVVWSDTDRRVYIFERTICFKTRFNLAHTLNMKRYTELIEEAMENQYASNLITLEMGSRGPFHLPGFKAIQSFIKMPSKEWNALPL